MSENLINIITIFSAVAVLIVLGLIRKNFLTDEEEDECEDAASPGIVRRLQKRPEKLETKGVEDNTGLVHT